MKTVSYIVLLTITFCLCNFVKAQDLEQRILTWLESNSREELAQRLESIERKYPNSSLPLFVNALLEQNGSKAVKMYEEIVQKYPDSKYTDNALLKIGQYYYAIGSYISARQYAERLVSNFEQSPLIPEARFLIARCYISTGYYESAESELKTILKNYSHSDYKSYAQEELYLLKEIKQQRESSSRFSSYDNQEYSEPQKYDSERGRFSIQIGAYRNRKNALQQSEFFNRRGYDTYIQTKMVDSDSFYLVWIGNFETREQAIRFGEKFKDDNNVAYQVVEK